MTHSPERAPTAEKVAEQVKWLQTQAAEVERLVPQECLVLPEAYELRETASMLSALQSERETLEARNDELEAALDDAWTRLDDLVGDLSESVHGILPKRAEDANA